MKDTMEGLKVINNCLVNKFNIIVGKEVTFENGMYEAVGTMWEEMGADGLGYRKEAEIFMMEDGSSVRVR